LRLVRIGGEVAVSTLRGMLSGAWVGNKKMLGLFQKWNADGEI
jgi:hypothetical protein